MLSKTIKNVLMVFALVCIVVLVVFTIELIVINSGGGDNDGSDPTQSDSPPEENGDPTGSPQSDPTGDIRPPGGTDGLPNGSPTAPTGKRYELLYSSTETLVVFADEELFEYDAQMEAANKFIYNDEDNASLLIHFDSLPQGAERRAEQILDGYLDGNDSHVSGESPIRRSQLRGVYVSGVNNTGETFEAWVHVIAGDIAMTFIINYRNDDQKNALYTVLDTLRLVEL